MKSESKTTKKMQNCRFRRPSSLTILLLMRRRSGTTGSTAVSAIGRLFQLLTRLPATTARGAA